VAGLDDVCERRADSAQFTISMRVAHAVWLRTRRVREESLGAKRRKTARHPLCVRVVALDTRALDGDGKEDEEQRAEGEGGREAAKGEHRVLASG
jgi:hypothetical protein